MTPMQEPKNFYSKMLSHLLYHVIKLQNENNLHEVIVITDTIPINEKRRAVEKSIKQTLSKMLPCDTYYRILHHASRSHLGLQIADYCNWAILRKWERADDQYYNLIQSGLGSERNISEDEL